MGTRLFKDGTCTIQYPFDTNLILDLADVMTSPVILFLISVGAYQTGAYFVREILPYGLRWIRTVLQNLSVRLRTIRERRSPTIRDPLVIERPTPRRRPPTPRNANLNAPGSLAILTPARDPPQALVTALNDYQNQAASTPNSPRARKAKVMKV